jgi:hypothetical protein
MRDSVSGKIVQFQISETEPDSGTFSGVYNVTFGSTDQISPEIYVPTDPKAKKISWRLPRTDPKRGCSAQTLRDLKGRKRRTGFASI